MFASVSTPQVSEVPNHCHYRSIGIHRVSLCIEGHNTSPRDGLVQRGMHTDRVLFVTCDTHDAEDQRGGGREHRDESGKLRMRGDGEAVDPHNLIPQLDAIPVRQAPVGNICHEAVIISQFKPEPARISRHNEGVELGSAVSQLAIFFAKLFSSSSLDLRLFAKE